MILPTSHSERHEESFLGATQHLDRKSLSREVAWRVRCTYTGGRAREKATAVVSTWSKPLASLPSEPDAPGTRCRFPHVSFKYVNGIARFVIEMPQLEGPDRGRIKMLRRSVLALFSRFGCSLYYSVRMSSGQAPLMFRIENDQGARIFGFG